jgi:hypothetical protein
MPANCIVRPTGTCRDQPETRKDGRTATREFDRVAFVKDEFSYRGRMGLDGVSHGGRVREAAMKTIWNRRDWFGGTAAPASSCEDLRPTIRTANVADAVVAI